MRPTAALLAPIVALLLLAPPADAADGWTWPVRGEVVTQYRNGDDPYAAGQHRGVDIAAPVGTPVVAAKGGTVVYAGVVGSSGLTVSQRTSDGDYVLSYLHLAATAVRSGQQVAAGTPLGAVGTSGSRSVTQPHLHFGLRYAADRHAYLDPLRFLAPPPAESPQPRPVPAPVPVEAPAPPLAVPGLPAPVAAPAPAPAAAGDPEPSASPVAAPAPWGFLAPASGGAPAHGPAAATASPALGGGSAPAAGTRHLPVARRADARRPTHVSARQPLAGPEAPASQHGATLDPVRPRPDAATSGRGLDVGWLLACVALVVASMLLAGPRRGRPAVRPGRTVVAALLRAGR